MFQRKAYGGLNARQKENYNFQKIAACLADCGFNCLRLTDDWHGADFLACHSERETVLRVQIKGRMVIDRKSPGKSIHIAFRLDGDCYVYEHDALVQHVEKHGHIGPNAVLWHDSKGFRTWPRPPQWAHAFLAQYKLPG